LYGIRARIADGNSFANASGICYAIANAGTNAFGATYPNCST